MLKTDVFHKTLIPRNLLKEKISRIEPCESLRPERFENAIVAINPNLILEPCLTWVGARDTCVSKKTNIYIDMLTLTNIFNIVEHVQAEHDEHDKVVEEVPSNSSGKHNLVDLCLDLDHQPS